jgi:hypothetical protein
MTVTKTRSELGASNLSKGKAWMYDFAKWMQANGFPGFDVVAQNGRGDGSGLTEWTIELKNVGDEYKLPGALDQARRDQVTRSTRWHWVAQKRHRKSNPGDGLAICTNEQMRQIARILDHPRVQAVIEEEGL